MKILSPAGNLESLKMAVFNGADEVYLGINDFNARNNIDGFNMDNLEEAINFAHIFNVKVLLAINILFNNTELQSALDIIVKAYNMGIDAFIIQDLGLASLVNKNYPEIEIHSSTQMGIHNLEGVKFIEQFGFKRVVLSRETPLEEIKRIKQNSNIEIEYFAQGALCVSFSGNCYISSYLCDASGNRGKCKQLCRLPYTLLKNNKTIKKGYLLSAKDFNMINNLKTLENAGVDVIKIEGRARRPFYIATSTKQYYNALHNKPFNVEDLKLAFNRDYTEGYFNGNGNIISKFNNHIGIYIGTIEKVNFGKNFNEVYFTSNRELSAKSTFKIFNNNVEQNTLTAYDLTQLEKGKYKLTTTQKLESGNKIHLIIDSEKENEVLSNFIRKKVKIKIFAQHNLPIKAEVNINNKKIDILGEVCFVAKNQPISKDNLVENFNKSEIFETELFIEKLDNIFMPKQKLNEFRRKVFERIYEEIINSYKHNLQTIKIDTTYNIIKFKDFQIVENLNEKFNNKNIIYSPSSYKLEEIKVFINKCEKENKIAYLDTPNFALENDILFLKDIIESTNISIIANNYYALNFKTNIVIGWGLNVYNNITASIYNKPIIIAESDISTKITAPYMTLRHCPLKAHLNANCKNCPFTNNFTYKMDNGKILKLKRKKLSTCTFYLTD